ncbi:MAG: double zinc ribbon domain-containing protein [Verrucomicrobiota bacterium]|jgi:ComF family protein|nr:double zinc ribbon domain-containing protein [Verrucomicrobiota bacterium]
MLNLLTACVERVADGFYPRVCPVKGCGEPSDVRGRHLCWSCRAKIKLHSEGFCTVCGHPAEGKVGHDFVCGICRQASPHFDRARAAGYFGGVLRELVHAFKYNDALWLRDELVDLMQGCLAAHFPAEAVDVVVPVPLHPVRRRERTYNQAEVLAEELARRLGRRCDALSLARVRVTETQTKFDAAQRRINILGAFGVARPEWIQQRCVLLVDDVMTTGATFNECARVLKKAGARAVWAVAAARGS